MAFKLKETIFNKPNVKYQEKLNLKATPEVRQALDGLLSQELYSKSSEEILKVASLCLNSKVPDKKNLPDNIKYIIERLISGLISTRDFLRHGSYATLQVLLQLHPETAACAILHIEKIFGKYYTEPGSANYIFGYVLAIGAVIRSGCALEDIAWTKRMIKNLVAFTKVKSFMDIICGQFLVNLLVMYKGKDNFVKCVWEEVHTKIQQTPNLLSPCLLWLRFYFTRDEYAKHIPKVMSNFQQDTYSKAAAIPIFTLFKNLFLDDVNVTPLIEDFFTSLLLNQRKGADTLAMFFYEAISNRLQTFNLKYKNVTLILTMTQLALPHLDSGDQIEKVLTPSLVELVVSSNSSIASVKNLQASLLQYLIQNKERDVQQCVVKRLVSTSAKFDFDAVTGTTILKQANEHLNAKSVQYLARALTMHLDEESSVGHLTLDRLMFLAQWISLLLCHGEVTVTEHREWKADLLSVLFEVIFFRNLNFDAQHKILKNFLRPLSCVTKFDDQAYLTKQVFLKAKFLLTKYRSELPLKPQAELYFFKISNRVEELQKAEAARKGRLLSQSEISIFTLLYCQSCLHILINPCGLYELVDEIDKCYEMMCERKSAKDTRNKKRKSEQLTDYGDETSISSNEAIMILLISILSNEDKVWRSVCTTIFKHICHGLHPSSLDRLVCVISPEELEPDKDIFTNGNEALSDEEMGECGDESAEEGGTSDEGNIDEDLTSEEEDIDAEGTSDEEEEEESAMSRLRMEMLRLAGPTSDDCSIELDSAPAEELNSLNKRLGLLMGQYFESKRLKRKNEEAEKLSKQDTWSLHHRVRVCDLILALINEAPSLDHLLPFVLPLLLAINESASDTLQQPFNNRLMELIRELVKVRRFAKRGSATIDDLNHQMNQLFFISNDLPIEMTTLLNNCCTFLARSGLQLVEQENASSSSPLNSDKLYETYGNQLKGAFTKNLKLMDGPLHLETGSVLVVFNKLIDVTFNASIRLSNRTKGIGMIERILFNERAISNMNRTHFIDALRKLCSCIVQAFDSVTDVTSGLSSFLISVLDLTKIMKKLFKSNPSWMPTEPWDEIVQAVSSFSDRFPSSISKIMRKALTKFANTNSIRLGRLESGEVTKKSLKRKRNEETSKPPEKSSKSPRMKKSKKQKLQSEEK